MSKLAQPTDAPDFTTNTAKIISLVLAAIFILMAVAQLFRFEKFPDTLSGYWLLNGQSSDKLVAALLVTAEVFALPFLLRVRISPLMRIFSLLAGWYVAIMWLILSVWVITAPNALQNAGILGATVPLHPGLWQVIFSLILLGLVGLISWDQRSILRLRRNK